MNIISGITGGMVQRFPWQYPILKVVSGAALYCQSPTDEGFVAALNQTRVRCKFANSPLQNVEVVIDSNGAFFHFKEISRHRSWTAFFAKIYDFSYSTRQAIKVDRVTVAELIQMINAHCSRGGKFKPVSSFIRFLRAQDDNQVFDGQMLDRYHHGQWGKRKKQ
ncbi:hypothetical protein JYB88_01435 [Shewanella cyperi]|uniref:Uncharacterized protein n=1 Tax=Shewanella cyperi TaxID=2814292 RepID=A0A974XNJ7_9GAMM|nr:hypothetical protein [Shewanella cyperi]QSX30356.1 hypothetical protein JYB88_01435 [Shewanella cyperi]